MAMVTNFAEMLIASRGLIINVSSVSSMVPYAFGSVYASSKAALNSYSRTLRQELRPFGVRVLVIIAGTVKSNMAVNPKTWFPENSVFQRAKHLYEARVGFSQKASSSPMSTDQFANKVVQEALKSEASPFWRTWFGRPDWLWHGGMSTMIWLGSCVSEWVIDFGSWRQFRLYELEAILKKERQLKQD